MENFIIFGLTHNHVLMQRIIDIIKELKSLLITNLGTNVNEVILFGSQIDDRSKPDSDLDVLIILKNDFNYQYKRKIRDFCFEISLKYDVIIDSKIISLKDLNSPKGKHPLYQDAINQGIYA